MPLLSLASIPTHHNSGANRKQEAGFARWCQVVVIKGYRLCSKLLNTKYFYNGVASHTKSCRWQEGTSPVCSTSRFLSLPHWVLSIFLVLYRVYSDVSMWNPSRHYIVMKHNKAEERILDTSSLTSWQQWRNPEWWQRQTLLESGHGSLQVAHQTRQMKPPAADRRPV